MLHYIWNLLPLWLQRAIQPEVDDIVAGFNKLEAQLHKVRDRHLDTHAVLHAIKVDIEAEIEDTKNEIDRAKRIADRIAKLVA